MKRLLLGLLLATPLSTIAAPLSGNILVEQLNTGNRPLSDPDPSIALSFSEATSPGFDFVESATNKGDWVLSYVDDPLFETHALITIVSENERFNPADDLDGGRNFATAAVAIYDFSNYFIAVSRLGNNQEYNMNTAFGLFPYDEFLAGVARGANNANGAALARFNGTPGLSIGDEIIDTSINGVTNINLTSIESPWNPDNNAFSSNGILLASAFDNDDNYATVEPLSNGTFRVYIRDNNNDFNATNDGREQGGVSFAYIPIDQAGQEGQHVVAAGRVRSDGSTAIEGGDFTIRKASLGTWFLTLPNHGAYNGTLLLTPVSEYSLSRSQANVDNIMSYEWDALRNCYIIQTRDLPNGGLQNGNDDDDLFFNFAFIGKDPYVAPVEPGPRVLEGELVILGASEEDDVFMLDFKSTFPQGASYQPQYSRELGGNWVDIPDASVDPIEGEPECFTVIAPKFGDPNAFYRVLVEGTDPSGPEPPIGPTLLEDPPEPESQILLLSANRSSGGTVSGRFYAFAGDTQDPLVPPDSPQELPTSTYDGDLDIQQGTAPDVLSVDLTGNGKPDPVFAWGSDDGLIQLVLPEVNGEGLVWADPIVLTISDKPIYSASQNAPGHIRIIACELDDDPQPELAVAYTNDQSRIQVLTVDFHGDFEMEPTISASDSSTTLDRSGNFIRSARFDLAAGDFDADPETPDQLVITTTKPRAEDEGVIAPNGSWRLYSRFFSMDNGFPEPLEAINPIESTAYQIATNNSSRSLFRVATVAADLDGLPGAELAVAYSTIDGGSQDWTLRTFDLTDDLASISSTGGKSHHSTSGDTGHPLTLLPIELDGTAGYELLYAGRQTDFFDISNEFSQSDIGGGTVATTRNDDNRRHIVPARLDSAIKPRGGTNDVLVSVREFVRDGSALVEMTVHRIFQNPDTGAYTFEQIARSETDNLDANSTNRTFALGTAPFDPLDIRLGVPRQSTRVDVNRPTVIINAPPIHFDVIDGIEFDVSDMFPVGDSPPFFARFTRSNEDTVTVSTNWNRSWDISLSAAGGTDLPLGLGSVEAEVRTNFGEEFDSYASEFETTVVEVEIDAVDDDRLYATTLTYNVWEYPIVLNAETVIGHIILVEPGVTRQNWFSSKTIFAQSYRPFHEVGNILSYRSVEEPYPGFETVRPIVQDSFTVSRSGGNNVWKLTKTSGQTTEEQEEFRFGIGTTLSFDTPLPWVPDVEATGDYSSSEFLSNTTTVTDSNGLVCNLGTLNPALPETAYTITPYVYWDRSGAMVLDYAVDIPLGTNAVPSFWNTNYSQKPDPTFILPWRHDPRKGLAVVGDQQRLTRDISTLPIRPRPRETVTVQARVSNYSLIGLDDAVPAEPVDARFYLGDPAKGGTMIHMTQIPASQLDARGKHLIEFPYEIPDVSRSSIAIYCVLDPLDEVDEIHEDNNTAWGEIFLRLTP